MRDLLPYAALPDSDSPSIENENDSGIGEASRADIDGADLATGVALIRLFFKTSG